MKGDQSWNKAVLGESALTCRCEALLFVAREQGSDEQTVGSRKTDVRACGGKLTHLLMRRRH